MNNFKERFNKKYRQATGFQNILGDQILYDFFLNEIKEIKGEIEELKKMSRDTSTLEVQIRAKSLDDVIKLINKTI